jgi:hypothetical protein
MFDWVWAYLTYRSGTRLITGGPAAIAPAIVAATVPEPRAARALA